MHEGCEPWITVATWVVRELFGVYNPVIDIQQPFGEVLKEDLLLGLEHLFKRREVEVF